MSGPGAESPFPASANAATSTPRPVGPSGYHTPVRASRLTVSTPLARAPAGCRLSFGTIDSGERRLGDGDDAAISAALDSNKRFLMARAVEVVPDHASVRPDRPA